MERFEQGGDFELVYCPGGDLPPIEDTGIPPGATREREQAAEETGRFFFRCLRGPGLWKGKVQLQNRVYVVVKLDLCWLSLPWEFGSFNSWL